MSESKQPLTLEQAAKIIAEEGNDGQDSAEDNNEVPGLRPHRATPDR